MSTSPETDPEQLELLATNQERLILHAMRFPSVRALVYSTCSVHERENEEVVRRVLQRQTDFVLDVAMPWWHRRGHELPASSDEEAAAHRRIAGACVRTLYPDDRTIGFFLCRFVRAAGAAEAADSAAVGNAELAAKLERLSRARRLHERHAAPAAKAARAVAAAPAGSVAAPSSAAQLAEPPAAESSAGAAAAAAAAAPAAAAAAGAAAVSSRSAREVPQWRLERDALARKKKRERAHCS